MWPLLRSLAAASRSLFGRLRARAAAEGQNGEGAVLAVRFLQDERVRRELGLNSAQVRRIVSASREVRFRFREAAQRVRARPQQERRAVARGLARDVALRVMQALEGQAVLTPAQRQRLSQLVWQNRGPAALVEPAVRQSLQLTEGQTRQIEAIRERILGQLRGTAPGGEGGLGRAEDRTRLRRQALDEALVLLTAEQRSRWEELKGPPAAFPLDGPVAPAAEELE
jgi:hypothetical protein